MTDSILRYRNQKNIEDEKDFYCCIQNGCFFHNFDELRHFNNEVDFFPIDYEIVE